MITIDETYDKLHEARKRSYSLGGIALMSSVVGISLIIDGLKSTNMPEVFSGMLMGETGIISAFGWDKSVRTNDELEGIIIDHEINQTLEDAQATWQTGEDLL